jgi:hypothetical protein
VPVFARRGFDCLVLLFRNPKVIARILPETETGRNWLREHVPQPEKRKNVLFSENYLKNVPMPSFLLPNFLNLNCFGA